MTKFVSIAAPMCCLVSALTPQKVKTEEWLICHKNGMKNTMKMKETKTQTEIATETTTGNKL